MYQILVDSNHFHRLFFRFIQRVGLVFHLIEIYGLQIDASDVAVVHGPVVNHPVVGVRCHGKLGSTG